MTGLNRECTAKLRPTTSKATGRFDMPPVESGFMRRPARLCSSWRVTAGLVVLLALSMLQLTVQVIERVAR